jgi:hypothetical protein
MRTTSSQEYSAGFCVTDWTASIDLVVRGGDVRGRGRARLAGAPRCPFPTAQPQIGAYTFSVRGVRDVHGFRLSLGGFEPAAGVYDYGGFALTLADRRTTVAAAAQDDERAVGRSSSRTRTSLGKLVRSRTVVRLSCRSCGG